MLTDINLQLPINNIWHHIQLTHVWKWDIMLVQKWDTGNINQTLLILKKISLQYAKKVVNFNLHFKSTTSKSSNIYWKTATIYTSIMRYLYHEQNMSVSNMFIHLSKPVN